MKVTDDLLERVTEKVRKIRALTVKYAQETGGGHFGGSLSQIEILAVLYGAVLKIDSKNPKWPGRDYFILSKGHGCASFGPVLAVHGFMDESLLATFNKFGAPFGMHTSLKMAGVEHPTGSLGHGLSVGLGIALAMKLDGKPNRVFVLQGDGEIEEGQVWEAAASSCKYKLDNLTDIVDKNNLQIDGFIEKIMSMEPIDKKFEAFNWYVMKINGHDMKEILTALEEAKKIKK